MRLTDTVWLRPLLAPGYSSKTPEAPSDELGDQTQPSLLEMVQDGAEELSQLRSLFASRREFEKKRGVAEESFDQILESDVTDKIDRIMALAESGEISAEALLRHAMALFPDDSDLVLILRELVRQKQARELVRGKLLAALQQAEAHAEPRALKAGINVALKARLFGARLAADPKALRQSYRQFLSSLELSCAQYQEWVMDYGVERRAIVVDFIEAALFTDMHALDPSCSRREFGDVLGALRQLRMLRSSDQQFVAALRCAWQMDEGLSLLLLLSVLQQPYSLQEILLELLGEPTRLATSRQRSLLLQTLLSSFKRVPAELFALDDARESVLTELLELADKAYRLESRHR
jgi:type III secretion protein W